MAITDAPEDVLRFLAARGSAGERTALVTLTGIEGSTSRGIGTIMAVAEDGACAGSFSGGCIEKAVVAEAIDAIRDGDARLVRFGAGSPYIDIRLPCGSGIDLLFSPLPPAAPVGAALELLAARKPVCLALDRDGRVGIDPLPQGAMLSRWIGEAFALVIAPPLRIVLIGQGEELTGTARLAACYGARVEAYTPDEGNAALLRTEGIAVQHLRSSRTLPDISPDPWSALLFLFHDRDWEEHLVAQALKDDYFYIGALGSRKTHEGRLTLLEAQGVSAELRARLRGPIGMIPATRDPQMLALSVLGEVAACYRDAVMVGVQAKVEQCE
ncbi:XdhC family protein [Sphingobium subterraneum]|uniref:Xanthine dehydrogenase accessory factor n=1 Tax=Sphingobium subterraneum TaxID=627688 RepID=A0A841J924_9SPHN|nr:XdhC family protein [Sphingobium subterraneum]MBB6124661.1 xanthine dehydrogenase accessory factor [Sphingobium subterraneum]